MDNDLSLSFRKTVFKSIEIPSSSKVKITVALPTKTTEYKYLKINPPDLDNGSSQSVFVHSRETIPSHLKTDIKSYWKIIKVSTLVMVWMISSYSLMANDEKDKENHHLVVSNSTTLSFVLYEQPKDGKLEISLKGRLLPPYYGYLTKEKINVWVQLMVMKEVPTDKSEIKESDVIFLQNVSDVWQLPVANHKLTREVPKVEYGKMFHLLPFKYSNYSVHLLRIQIKTQNLKSNFTVAMKYNLRPTNPKDGIIYAALILIFLYGLIILDIIHRTLASMLASTISIATLAAFDQRPSLAELISWIDMETLTLLFAMMTMVSIFSETGVFDYAAVMAFKKTGGRLWPLINVLCFITALSSCFLDSVTTALLITPVTIKLCEVMKINPVQILMYTLIFGNIGGAITPIGDPPNVIIASNSDVIKSGINFGIFTLHMATGTLLISFVVYIQIRIMYRDMKYYRFDEPSEIEDLKREIAVWERTAASVSSYSKDENHVKESLLKQMATLQIKLKDTVHHIGTSIDDKPDFEELKKQYPIRNKSLLIKSGLTLILVMVVFFFNSIPALSKLGLGWTALLGSILLLILYDTQDLESIFARVEWSTLIFFASLFILMEALSRLGLIDWIGHQTQAIITSVGPESRLATAIVLILWVSAIASAFVDNLPITTMMIRIATDLANNEELNLPLPPLIWALSFGACFGGNGSLFGSSSNIICAGLAEQHGYRFTFMHFTKVGLPVMISSVLIITMYLLVCHVILQWH
ncbi:unnamed protein product [Psylliodes chrysocephalus]|uniref:Citrate transporter-like domain-containing protein n=1 Tax=Psylliodes chrysocephalus TaxID=3402493 RepID=A0A9P0GFT2_9CUCU|nr:unnamed protein product [Psylliodes chrysocephala]